MATPDSFESVEHFANQRSDALKGDFAELICSPGTAEYTLTPSESSLAITPLTDFTDFDSNEENGSTESMDENTCFTAPAPPPNSASTSGCPSRSNSATSSSFAAWPLPRTASEEAEDQRQFSTMDEPNLPTEKWQISELYYDRSDSFMRSSNEKTRAFPLSENIWTVPPLWP